MKPQKFSLILVMLGLLLIPTLALTDTSTMFYLPPNGTQFNISYPDMVYNTSYSQIHIFTSRIAMLLPSTDLDRRINFTISIYKDGVYNETVRLYLTKCSGSGIFSTLLNFFSPSGTDCVSTDAIKSYSLVGHFDGSSIEDSQVISDFAYFHPLAGTTNNYTFSIVPEYTGSLNEEMRTYVKIESPLTTQIISPSSLIETLFNLAVLGTFMVISLWKLAFILFCVLAIILYPVFLFGFTYELIMKFKKASISDYIRGLQP